MTSSVRLGALGAVGVLVAGLAHAGWLGLLWVAGADAMPWWVAVGAQAGITLVLAAAVGWQLRRAVAVLEREIDDLRTLAVKQAAPAGLRSAGVLADRFDFLQRLTARLADRLQPESALLVLTVLPCAGRHDVDKAGLEEVADLLQTYPVCVHGAIAGRLAEDQFALCLPAHGVVGESAQSLITAVQATPLRQGPLRCVIGAVDDLAGRTLGEALVLLDRASRQALQGGPGEVVVLSARQPAGQGAQAMSPA